MPVIARYELDDTGTVAADSALGNGPQHGVYVNGAVSDGTRAVLDGVDDIVKLEAPEFQLPRGTLDIRFTQTAHVGEGPNTILSRDSMGETPGGFRAEILADGAIRISHEGEDETVTFLTDPGFLSPGNDVRLVYSWNEDGPGRLTIENFTTGVVHGAEVPAGLTMDQGELNQKWMIGIGQSQSHPWLLDNLDAPFQGTVEYFEISDSVDNVDPGPEPDGIVEGTEGGDLIDRNYDGDPNGDRVDAGDSILDPGPDDDRIYAYGGNDTVHAGRGDDLVFGGTGDDLLHGEKGDDTLHGGRGDDTIYGGNGSDLVYGGQGDDYIDTSGDSRPLPDRGYPGLYPADRDPYNDRDTVYGGAGNDTIFTGDDNDVIHGRQGDDYIDGGFDDDLISGGYGNDTLIGGEGSDTIWGSIGDDVIYGGMGPGIPDAVNIPDDRGDLRPDNGRDLLYGGQGNDTVYGMDDNDTIYGGMGDDLLDGGVDNDLIHGGRGNDTIIGGHGADTMYGGADRDLFIVTSQSDGFGDYVDGNEGGDDWDTLDLRGAGPLRIDYETNPENGTVTFLDGRGDPVGTLTFRNIENVIPCFTPGTMVATPRGEVPVEDLRTGDKVITRDNGIQEIRWIGSKHLDWPALCANPHLKPVLIRQGSLGNGLPERDMLVSPNHRMLVANDRTALYFEEHEVLVAAKHLIGGKGVRAVESMGVDYIHFMFDRHEVVLANGAWTESFQPGDYTLKGMGNAQRQEIFELFPELKSDAGLADYQAARRTLKRHEAALLLR